MRETRGFREAWRAALVALLVGAGCSEGSGARVDPAVSDQGKCDPMPKPFVKGTATADEALVDDGDENEVICDGEEETRPEPRDPTPTYDHGGPPIEIPTPH